MADYYLTNESLGYPEYPAPPEPPPGPTPQWYPRDQRPAGVSYQQLLDIETAPWAGAYNPQVFHTPEAIKQRQEDLKKFETRLRIENLLAQRREAAERLRLADEWRRAQIARQRAADVAKAFPPPKPLPESLRKQISGVTESLQALIPVARSFKGEEYVSTIPLLGIGSETIGNLENWARESIPGLSPEMAKWWRSAKRLDELKERNAAFGATLSANEERNWKATAIHPGMKPENIAYNLNVRAAILKRQHDRLLRGAAVRYDPKEIEEIGGSPIPERAARWQDEVDLDQLVSEGRQLTGLNVGSDRVVLTPAQRRMIKEQIRQRGQ